MTHEIPLQVKAIRFLDHLGTVVKTLDKSQLVVPGKLKSADGVYRIRFAHDIDAIVTDLKLARP